VKTEKGNFQIFRGEERRLKQLGYCSTNGFLKAETSGDVENDR